MLRRILLFAVVALGVALPAAAQSATATSKLAWDEAASSLPTAQTNTYKTYSDGATTGVALTGVTCAGTTSPFQCQVPFPAYTPTSHTLTVTASNAAGESLPSAPLSFAFIVMPAVPTNVHIIP